MSSCTLDERDRARRAIRAIGDRPDILAIDLIDPDTDPTRRWTIEIACDGTTGSVPPTILRALADAGLSIRGAGPRRGCYRVVAVV